MKKTFEHIEALERSLLTSEIRNTPNNLDRLLSDDFIEIGQSGRLYNKSDIIALLSGEGRSAAQFFDFEMQVLSSDLILAHYKSVNKGTTIQRHSLWEKNDADWHILYHEAEHNHG